MNKEVSDYIDKAPPEQKDIMLEIRRLIHQTVRGVNEKFKWSRPVFSTTKDFMYFKTAKGYVTVGFFNFEQLKDDEHLLEGTGKNMRHIKLKKLADVNTALLQKWFTALTSENNR